MPGTALNCERRGLSNIYCQGMIAGSSCDVLYDLVMESKGQEQKSQFFHYRWENNVGMGRKTIVGKKRVWGLCYCVMGFLMLTHFPSYFLGNQMLFCFEETVLSDFNQFSRSSEENNQPTIWMCHINRVSMRSRNP